VLSSTTARCPIPRCSWQKVIRVLVYDACGRRSTTHMVV